MLPPQSQQHLNRLAKQDTQEVLKKQNGKMKKNRTGSQPQSQSSISIFQSEYDKQDKRKDQQNSKQESKGAKSKERSISFATFGNDINARDNKIKQSNSIQNCQILFIQSFFETENTSTTTTTFDFKKFNTVFQDDLSYLIKYALESNAQKYNISPHTIAQNKSNLFRKYSIFFDKYQMKKEVQSKSTKPSEKDEKGEKENEPQKDKQKKQASFLERNYDKQFKAQQKIFNDSRQKKLERQQNEQNNYEKIDPPIWKASLALMKYQVQKDQYQIENNQRANQHQDINTNPVQQYNEQLQKKEEQKLKDRQRKGPQARTISVKIQMNESMDMQTYKKPLFKSDDQIKKDVQRMIAIDQRQSEKNDKKVNDYFIKVQRRLQMLYKLQPGLEKEKYREQVMKELRDNEQIFQNINDQIISKYETYLVENIIDDILLESVFLLGIFENKSKKTKKQLRNAVLTEYKNCFIEYFDDAQEAALDLVYVGKPKPQKVVVYDHVFIETGYGLLLSTLDLQNKFKVHRAKEDHFDRNNVALLNLIARDIAYELVGEVAESFDKCTHEFTNQLFDVEFK